jgi:hypothetical protein
MDGAGNFFNHLITDYDAAIKAAAVTAELRKQGIDSSYSPPHAHHRNPAENYMRKVKDGAMAMQALAGLPDSLVGCCWSLIRLFSAICACLGDGITRTTTTRRPWRYIHWAEAGMGA